MLKRIFIISACALVLFTGVVGCTAGLPQESEDKVITTPVEETTPGKETPQAEPVFEYTVTIENPQTHIAKVALTMSDIKEASISLGIRTVTGDDKPFIKAMAITSELGHIANGPSFEGGIWTIEINTEGSNSITIEYNVELLLTDPGGDYESYIGEEYAIIDAKTLFLYPLSTTVKSLIYFVGPEDWVASSVWKQEQINLFSVYNYDELINFVAFGPFIRSEEKVGNLTIILSVHKGVESKIDIEETFKAIQDLTEYYGNAFKPLDKKKLIWLVVPAPIKGGGVRGDSFLISAEQMGTSFWNMLAHEYVHLWNGNGVLTPRWFREGATVFLSYKALADIGIIDETIQSEKLRRDWERYLSLRESGEDKAVAEGTLDDPDILYTKGHLVTYVFDLLIRDTTNGERDFIDMTQYLAGDYWGETMSNEDLLKVINSVTGVDFYEFFSRYVYGINKLPLEKIGNNLSFVK